MQADFWLERWQQNQIGFHAEDINAHLQKFWGNLNIPAGSTIFVPLCGKSSDMLWLLSLGYHVIGVELSPLAVNRFFTDNRLSADVTEQGAFQRWQMDGLTIFQGDFFDLSTTDLKACDAVYDRAALIALPLGMRQQYAAHLRQIVPALSHTLLVTLAYNQDVMAGPPFSVDSDEVQALFGTDYTIECLLTEDVLEQHEYFKERGLAQLIESVYWLSQRSGSD